MLHYLICICMLICLALGTKVYVCSFVIMIFQLVGCASCNSELDHSSCLVQYMCLVSHVLVTLLHNCTSFGCCTALQKVRQKFVLLVCVSERPVTNLFCLQTFCFNYIVTYNLASWSAKICAKICSGTWTAESSSLQPAFQ